MPPHFHPLETDIKKPAKFTDPFCYEPHPLCLLAAKEVQEYIASDGRLLADASRGKMFGVLVVETDGGQLGYLAAFSGLLCGSNDWTFFVPPVFDATQPDGYFKTREAEITAINRRIDSISRSESHRNALREISECAETNAKAEDDYRQSMREAKARRDARRLSPLPVPAEEAAAMTRESQHMKAELRRIKQRGAELLAAKKQAVKAFEDEISMLKARRRQMSDALQRWLFSQYSMLNALGASAKTSAPSSPKRRSACRRLAPETAAPPSCFSTLTSTACAPCAWRSSGGAGRQKAKCATICTSIRRAGASACRYSATC